MWIAGACGTNPYSPDVTSCLSVKKKKKEFHRAEKNLRRRDSGYALEPSGNNQDILDSEEFVALLHDELKSSYKIPTLTLS